MADDYDKVVSPRIQQAIKEFAEVLQREGPIRALRFVNARTPHRYTGFYRFDVDTLRNVALYDRYEPDVEQGAVVPLSVTYCSLVGKQEAPLIIRDATTDSRVKGVIDTPVVSYCGVLVRDAEGRVFGTLCHFDMQRCQARPNDVPLLEAAGQLLYRWYWPAATAGQPD